MTARLASRFASLKSDDRAALVAYVMASDPDHETCLEILRGLPAAGADVIELGFPFTDPMADGPSIQKAAQRALKAGGSLAQNARARARAFASRTKTRRSSSWATPIRSSRWATRVRARSTRKRRRRRHRRRSSAGGRCAAPRRVRARTISRSSVSQRRRPTMQRLTKVLEGASGFLYYVSVAGVTGAKAALTEDVRAAVERLKRATSLPIAVGLWRARAGSGARHCKNRGRGRGRLCFCGRNRRWGRTDQAADRVLRKVQLLSEAVRLARELEGTRA